MLWFTPEEKLEVTAPIEKQVVRAVAMHENLLSDAAREKVSQLLGEQWGPPAIRQIIRDEIDDAVAQSRWPDVDELIDTYQWCCRHLPFGVDRRTQQRP